MNFTEQQKEDAIISLVCISTMAVDWSKTLKEIYKNNFNLSKKKKLPNTLELTLNAVLNSCNGFLKLSNSKKMMDENSFYNNDLADFSEAILKLNKIPYEKRIEIQETINTVYNETNIQKKN